MSVPPSVPPLVPVSLDPEPDSPLSSLPEPSVTEPESPAVPSLPESPEEA
ncbi:MAG: hypothetical protein H6712_14740 [Myxococcales bacterium]|nr:hypothetical protein [Myxococcales bacterium]